MLPDLAHHVRGQPEHDSTTVSATVAAGNRCIELAARRRTSANPTVAYSKPQSSDPSGERRQVAPQRHLGHPGDQVDQGLDADGQERQR